MRTLKLSWNNARIAIPSLVGAIPSLVVPSCRNYSIQQTLHLASQSPTNNLVLGTMLDYNLRYGLFTRELTLRHSFISWWTLKFINGGTFTAIERQLCTLYLTSTLSNNGVLILARINCSHFRWWSYFQVSNVISKFSCMILEIKITNGRENYSIVAEFVS